MPENPDAKKAALAEALERMEAPLSVDFDCEKEPPSTGGLECAYCGADMESSAIDTENPDSHEPTCEWAQSRRVLADLSPAAKEILEKAQAHDRLREELISCQVFLAAPATKAERTIKKRSIDAALKEPE